MTKTATALLAAVLGFAFAAAPSASAQTKIGIIDMNRVFAEYYKTKDAEKEVNDQQMAEHFGNLQVNKRPL